MVTRKNSLHALCGRAAEYLTGARWKMGNVLIALDDTMGDVLRIVKVRRNILDLVSAPRSRPPHTTIVTPTCTISPA